MRKDQIVTVYVVLAPDHSLKGICASEELAERMALADDIVHGWAVLGARNPDGGTRWLDH